MNFKTTDTEKLLELLGPKRFKIHPAQIDLIEKELISRNVEIPSDDELIWQGNYSKLNELTGGKTSGKIVYGLVVLAIVLNLSGYLFLLGIPLTLFCSIIILFIEKPFKRALFRSIITILLTFVAFILPSIIFSLIKG